MDKHAASADGNLTASSLKPKHLIDKICNQFVIGGFVLKNVLVAVGIIVVLATAALFGVDFYTHHGESQVIPDLRGSYVEEAEQILAKKGLYPQVIDSVYVRDKKQGTIVDQIPAPNSTVKSNRPVYLIINSRKVRQVNLPEISDVSYRQADAMLQSVGLSVASVEYAPSEFKDLVQHADDFFKIELLRPAKKWYQKALKLNIESEKIKHQIAECDRLLAFERKVIWVLIGIAAIVILLLELV